MKRSKSQNWTLRLSSKTRVNELVRGAQAGDDLCFAELVCAFQDFAVAYAASILKDYQLAEDVAQEAFLDAYRGLKTLREPAAFIAWFRTIVFKHCDRVIRKRRLLIKGLEHAIDQPSPRPSPDEQLQSKDIAAGVWNAINDLPAAERTVVLLYYMSEQSQASIANFLGITTNAVKVKLYGARRRLKQNLIQNVNRGFKVVRPSNDALFSRSVMSAALSLQLYYLDSHGARRTAGSTVARRKPQFPRSATWLIEPRQVLTSKEWEALFAFMEQSQIPGLGGAGQLTDEVLERLSRFRHLTYLDLQGSTAVTDDGLRYLAHLPQLEHLTLSGTKITDCGLAVLRELPNLKTLDICHQEYISDAGIAHLNFCEQLERVNLMGTRTGDNAIRAVLGKPNLRQLFAGTNVTDEGLALLVSIPRFVTPCNSPRSLSLMNFQHHPTYLWLNLKAPITDHGLAQLGKLAGLSALNLFATTGHTPFDDTESKMTSAGLAPLLELRHLDWLGCCARLCTDEAMEHFGSMRGLRFLMCQDAVAGDKGFIAVSRSPSLEYIWGRRCQNLASEGFSALQQMPSLRGLAVSCRNVSSEGLATLRSFPALREFMPIDVSDAGFQHLGHCRNLDALYCMYCQGITDSATRQISSLHLRTYQVWDSGITDESLNFLSKMSSLEHVGFFKCSGITDSGIIQLGILPRLKEVDLEQLAAVTRDAALAFSTNVRVNYVA